MDSALVSMILKFADDTKVLEKANSDKDREIIQQYLHIVLDWSCMWQMPFNTIKCVIMHFGARNTQHTYVVENQALKVVREEKENVSNSLKSARQCQLAYAKVSKALGLISKTISFKSASVLLNLYKSLVGPHLKYCVSTWSPYYEKTSSCYKKNPTPVYENYSGPQEVTVQ